MTLHSPPILFSDYAAPRRRQLSDGIDKTLYDGPEPGTRVLYFKDDMAIKGEILTVNGKGAVNNRISDLFMSRLNDLGIDTHFIRMLNMREQLIRATESLPFIVTLHNVASGAFAKRLGLEEGLPLSKPIPEFSLRSKELNAPVVAAEHLTSLGWSRFEEIDDILLISQRVNDFLNGQFLALNMRLISFRLEFGRLYASSDPMDSQVVITEDLCPDNFNLLDLISGKRLDRQGAEWAPQQAREIYREIARRFGVLGPEMPETPPSLPSLDILFPKGLLNKRSLKKREKPHGHNSL